MLRRMSRFRSDLGAGGCVERRVVVGSGLPSVVRLFRPGWAGWRPRGVSAITRKWPVKGGPMFEGRDSGSTCDLSLAWIL